MSAPCHLISCINSGEKRKRPICTFCVASVKKGKTEKTAEAKLLYNCDNCDSLDSLVDSHIDYKSKPSSGSNYFELKNYFAGYPPVNLESFHLAGMEDKNMIVFNHSLSVN